MVPAAAAEEMFIWWIQLKNRKKFFWTYVTFEHNSAIDQIFSQYLKESCNLSSCGQSTKMQRFLKII